MKNVILAPNPYRDKNFQTVREAQRILKNAGVQAKVCLPFEIDRSYELPRDIRFCRLDRELPNAEMVVCFGGDGTILHMAKAATRKGIPLLGVNVGTMGFMAELECAEMGRLARLATGDYTMDTRMMLDVTIQRDRDIVFHDICLNDVTITKGAVGRIVYLNVKCDGVTALECGGDGMIISTPTGSTAYNLSAGGPVVEPDARNILLTPICAHDINSHCIVVSDKRTVAVQMTQNARRNCFLSVDGGKAIRVNMGDTVIIKKSHLETKLVRLNERNLDDVLKTKFRKA